MEEGILFNDLMGGKPEWPEIITPKVTCRTCKHRQKWEYENGRIAQYCGQRKSGRTHNGLLKIKTTNIACGYYERED